MKKLNFLLALIFVINASCLHLSSTTPAPTINQPPQNLNGIPDPVISPSGISNANAYNQTVEISLSSPATGIVLHYTTDNSTPSCSSPTYSAAFTITGNNETKIFMNGKNLDKFSNELNKYDMIVTFNGKCFATLSGCGGSSSCVRCGN